ncbi:hypothetical protein AHAS_Ahas14G0161200 [Arachis hypogaea]
MPRIGRYTKTSKLDTICQKPQIGAVAASSSHQVDYPNVPSSGDGAPVATYLRLFRPPRSEPLTYTNGVQNSKSGDEDLDLETDEIYFFEQQVDNLFAESEAHKCKGHKTAEF